MYPLFVTFVIVAAANHFLIDAVFGGLTVALGARVADWTARTRPVPWAFVPAEATA